MSGRRASEQTFTQSFFFHLMHAIARAHASTCTTSLLTYLLLFYYPVYCPSFPWQRGLDSVTCLNGLTAFLHLLRSWTVDNRSLSRSLLMLSNHFLGCPEGSYHLLRNLRSFWAIFFSSRRWRWPNQRKRLYLTKSSILEIPIRVLRHRYFFA